MTEQEQKHWFELGKQTERAVGFSTPTTEECYDAKKLRFLELDEAGCFPGNVKLRWEELKRYLADNTP